MKKSKSGFTIVELLIVIVVIAILAAISIVAYNGIQARAKDGERLSEIRSIEKALALYYADEGTYPTCSNAPFVPGGLRSACTAVTIAPSLVPKYISSFPTDPINTSPSQYWYGIGYKKTGDLTYAGVATADYITGAKLEAQGCPCHAAFVVPNVLNYLGGS